MICLFTACGGIIDTGVESEGQIQSPGYPGPYGNNLDCQWNVTIMPGYQVQLDISKLEVKSLPLKLLEKLFTGGFF